MNTEMDDKLRSADLEVGQDGARLGPGGHARLGRPERGHLQQFI